MISVLLSRLVILTFGTLYPAYASYKTVKTKNVRDYVRWMMYWIVFAVYTCVEIFSDIFIAFWFPFYYEIKILFIFWLICPATRGSTYLFRKVINPQLSKHEQALDSHIDSMWDHGYDIARKIGAQGLDYLGQLFLDLIRKGQITAANFLPKVENDIAQTNTVIDSSQQLPPGGNISDDNNLDEEDFDILMAENPEFYKGAKRAASRKQHENDQVSEEESASEEDLKSKSRPLKLASKNKGKGMALRERRRKNIK